MHVSELDTPSVIVDLDLLEQNIGRLQRYLDEHRIANRPHCKTHKIPEIAHMQLRAGAVGITCQKLGEAEVFAQAGIGDILITYNIVGAQKLERLVRLANRIALSVVADSDVTVDGVAQAAEAAGVEITVLVEFDSGQHRCGVMTPKEAFELAHRIADAPSLRFGGLMTYPTNDTTDRFVREAGGLLSLSGIELPCVSGGGTPEMYNAHKHPSVTEHRAGMYVYGDRYTLRSGAMTLEQCSLAVLTTVVSKPTETRAVLDAGSKVFSSDMGDLGGFGLIREYPDAVLARLSEEHGVVDLSSSESRPEIGERVTVIPNHCCPVSNLVDEVYGLRSGEVEVAWPVAARGAVR